MHHVIKGQVTICFVRNCYYFSTCFHQLLERTIFKATALQLFPWVRHGKKKKSICLLLELTHAKYNDESQNVIICLLHGKRKASHDIWLQSIVSKGTHRDMWLIINTWKMIRMSFEQCCQWQPITVTRRWPLATSAVGRKLRDYTRLSGKLQFHCMEFYRVIKSLQEITWDYQAHVHNQNLQPSVSVS